MQNIWPGLFSGIGFIALAAALVGVFAFVTVTGVGAPTVEAATCAHHDQNCSEGTVTVTKTVTRPPVTVTVTEGGTVTVTKSVTKTETFWTP
jgi:hypothetical protein